MRRRQLLSMASMLPFAAHLGRLRAAPSDMLQAATPRLLLVFLRGAYDCNSLLVPTASDFYYASRPTIAIARPGEANGALPIDSRWGLHPVLAGSIAPLFQAGQACFVPFAGINDLSRSHFETQDAIELGQSQDGRRDYGSGFLNRLAQVLASDRRQVSPMAFTNQLPLSLRGPQQAANMALGTVGRPVVDEARSSVIAAMYQGTRLADAVHEGFAVRDAVQRSVQDEMERAGRDAISSKGFALVAQRMAGLMRERFDLGFIDVGGWDTHINQGGASGQLAGRLDELGRGLAGFAREIGAEPWRHTVVVVVSDLMEASDWSPSLRLLAQRGHQLSVVRVRCDEDHSPDFHGELELCDAETGDLLTVAVTKELLDAYRAELEAHVERTRDACRRLGGRLVEAPVERPFDQLLRQVLAPSLEHP